MKISYLMIISKVMSILQRYYKDCMAAKESPVWSKRNGLPVSYSCMRTIHDAYTARRYEFDVKFEKMTDR